MADDNTPRITPEEAARAICRRIDEARSAGQIVTVDPDDADMMGAFVEDALSAEDALASRFDDVAEG